MIRPTLPNDFPQLLDIQIGCIRDLAETYSPEEINNWIGYLAREGAKRYEAYENRVYIDDDRIGGFVSWSQNEQEHMAAIECLYTLKEHRGKSIGRLLLLEAEANIPNDMTIGVRSTLNARSFYEQHGYIYTDDAISRAGFRIALLEKKRDE